MQLHQSSETLTWHVVSGSLRGFLVAKAGSKAVGRRLGILGCSTGNPDAIPVFANDERWLIPDLEGTILQAALPAVLSSLPWAIHQYNTRSSGNAAQSRLEPSLRKMIHGKMLSWQPASLEMAHSLKWPSHSMDQSIDGATSLHPARKKLSNQVPSPPAFLPLAPSYHRNSLNYP